MATQYALPPTNLGISAATVSHHAFMFPQPPPIMLIPQPPPIMLIPQPPPPPIMVTRIWRRVQHPHQPSLWRLGQVIMTPPFPLAAAYHDDQYPPRPSGQHDQHGINNMMSCNVADNIQETNSNNLDAGGGRDIITTTSTSSDDHIDHDEETDDDDDDDDKAAAADCAVCLDEFYGDVGVLVNCGHKFHVGCINEWLKEKNNCPLCRALVYANS
ncbi:hypothetical protein CASFOL_021179 [Castilleja foliolosa]|uniref:RING-type domain-containing protein n=1 Tax=Castilleja foliolosa TaxID=1961234 RepID=A0ABD3CVU0_9LAMI